MRKRYSSINSVTKGIVADAYAGAHADSDCDDIRIVSVTKGIVADARADDDDDTRASPTSA